jgi:hypothetical protein
VLLVVDVPRDIVLLLGVRYDLLALEPQLLRLVVGAQCDFVVGRGTTEPALLCPVRAVGVLPVLEVEADLVEALFCCILFVLTEISTVYDGVDYLAWERLEVAAALDATDALEAECVPDATGGDVGLVYEVEDGVCVALVMLA